MTSLLGKLHYQNNETLVVINLPQEIKEEFESAINFTSYSVTSEEITSFVLLFVKDIASLNECFLSIVEKLNGDTKLWIGYPKKTSRNYKTDITRDSGWEILGQYNYEPVSLIALNNDFSIMRFRHVNYIKKMVRPLSARISQTK